MGKLVLMDIAGPVATLTLNRSERHNSLVPELLEELLAALADLTAAVRAGGGAAQSDLRVLVLQANGRSFSTGGDVRGFFDQGDRVGPYAEHLVQQLNDVVLALLEFPLPVVTAVQGMVTGGSLGLVLASDVVLAAPDARFAPYYPVVGFSPDGGWTALLPQVIGVRRATEVLLRNLTVTAEEAAAWGLVSRLVPAAELRSEAARVAADIAAMKPGAIARTRHLLRAAFGDAAARLAEEHRQFCEQVVTVEAMRGMAAFLGKN